MHLEKSAFAHIVKNTPLISIDLIIENQAGEYLLGLRNNRPARGYWFVPGGRIRKDECIEEAFLRITKDELGPAYPINNAELSGVYEHFYDDNVFEDESFGTHYVVLGYRLMVSEIAIEALPKVQHQVYQWFTPDAIMRSALVHKNTKAYFN